ncbi:efflux RND transporter periplasmic adaptor subunit [Bacteroidota bacterium]
MRRIDRRIIIIGGLIFTLGMAYGLMRYLINQKKEPPRQSSVETKRFVKIEKVKLSVIVSPVVAEGRISSMSEIDIVAEASGKIISGDVSLKKGSAFSKGDLLFTIYPDEVALALKARKSQFLNLLANLLPDLNIDYPEHEKRFREFFLSVKMDEDLPDFPPLDSEKIRIFLASNNILSEYYNILKDELKLKRHNVFAPFDGTYTQVSLEVGAYTNAGGKVALAIRTDELELEVPVKLEKYFDAKWIKIGDKVEVISDVRSLSWSGIVIRKNQFVDENTQSQGIFVKLRSFKSKPILEGEYLKAIFPGHPIEGAIEIPRNAVFNYDEVFIVINGRLQRKTVNIIKRNDYTVIINNLSDDDLLVMQPLINVQEGTQVTYEGDPNAKEEMKKSGNKPGNKDGEKEQKENN